MRFLREQSREVQLEDLRRFYHRLEQDGEGDIAIKEAMRRAPESSGGSEITFLEL